MISYAHLAAVPPGAYNVLQAHARHLFALYGDFLRQTQACGTFDFTRYEEETRTLPIPYSDHNGEVLLALIEAEPAACIAYRSYTGDPTGLTCEIKRLFVTPTRRSLGLARKLVAEALARATAQPFNRIILDTDVVNMPGALALYRSFGFREYAPQQGNIAFLDLSLEKRSPHPG